MINIQANLNWLGEQVKTNADRLAISSEDQDLTYQQLYDLVNERTQNLISIGINSNTIVGVIADHSIQFVIDMFSVWNLGAILVPLNNKLSNNEVNEKANFIGCRIIEKPNPRSIQARNVFTPKQYNETHSALMMFTSGSTGQHKAVQHTFKSLYASTQSIDEKFHFAVGEKWLASLPFFRIGGFQMIIRSVLSGGTLCIPSSAKSEIIDASISHYEPHYISLVGTSLKAVIENDKLNLAKAIFVGGGPVDNELMKISVNKKLNVYKVYGSTETGSMITLLDPVKNQHKIDSAGLPLAGVELKIEDDEVLVKSDSLFNGYFRNRELTTERLTGNWFYTGDEGFLDEDGYLILKGRLDDMIISGGEKIHPVEVEKELMAIENVTQAKVFGIPDEKWGEKVCAVFVSNKKLNLKEIKKKLKETLPEYKIPKDIKDIESLPIDEMGKVDINNLQNLFKHDKV